MSWMKMRWTLISMMSARLLGPRGRRRLGKRELCTSCRRMTMDLWTCRRRRRLVRRRRRQLRPGGKLLCRGLGGRVSLRMRLLRLCVKLLPVRPPRVPKRCPHYDFASIDCSRWLKVMKTLAGIRIVLLSFQMGMMSSRLLHRQSRRIFLLICKW